jgi:predicted HTH domain antitoxin
MMQVQLTVPEGVLTALKKGPHEMPTEIRLAAAIHWYQQHVLSMELAAEVAGLTRGNFLAELARRRVDVFSVDDEDFRREVAPF